MKANYDKGIADILSDIRRSVEVLPNGQRNTAINRIERLSLLLKKKVRRAELADAPAGPGPEQIAGQYEARKAIYSAMLQGRHITLKDSEEFRTSQMHTDICKIRKRIFDRNLPLVMRDKWVEKDGRRFKEYWLENVES